LRVQTDDGRLDEKRIGEKFLIALRSHDWELMRTILAPDIVGAFQVQARISGESHGVDLSLLLVSS
jgi:hypothetical protein